MEGEHEKEEEGEMEGCRGCGVAENNPIDLCVCVQVQVDSS